ncbi:MAG: Gfo/Idh/MocA family oxidoreductase [Armatimonadetes bacterium]|nr:Gfo/Idh/MocA family oxidoreductase [Armatimonadota bacterium]
MPVKVGVVGAGIFGVNHLNTFRQLSYTGVAELAAVAEINPDRAEWVRANYGCPVYLDYNEMLEKEDLDGVSVVTPDHLHRPVTLAACAAGKHVLCEKPLDVTVEGCQEMIDAARRANVLLQVDFHKRYDPEHIAMERRVSSGELGKILYGKVCMEDRIEVPVDWFPHWAPSSSPGWFLGVHFFDLVSWVMKSTGKRVFAVGRKETLNNDYGIDTYDSISAMVEFANGAVISFDLSWILPREFEAVVNQEIKLVGTKGLWEIDTQYRGSRSCVAGEGMKTYNNGFISTYTDKQGRTIYRGYGVESIEDFVRNILALKNGSTLDRLAGKYPSGEDGLEVTKIAVAAHESARTGKVIDIS